MSVYAVTEVNLLIIKSKLGWWLEVVTLGIFVLIRDFLVH